MPDCHSSNKSRQIKVNNIKIKFSKFFMRVEQVFIIGSLEIILFDSRLAIEIAQRIVIDFHVMTVALNGQTHQPAKVYEEKWPVDWDFEDLEKCAEPCDKTYRTDLFPQVELSNCPENWSVRLNALQTEIPLNEGNLFVQHLIRIGQSRGSKI